MTKAVVKLVSVVMVLMLIFSTALNLSAVDLSESSTATTYKISDKLAQKMANSSNDEKIPVCIWMKDIDYSDVESAVVSNLGYSYANLEATSKSMDKLNLAALTNARTTELQNTVEEFEQKNSKQRKDFREKVSNYTSEKRKIAKQMYIASNSKIIKEEMAENNIIFSSNYAPMIIAELTKDQITNFSERSEVEDINIYVEPEPIDCGCQEESNDSLNEVAGVRSGNYDYIYGVDAYYTRFVLNLTGDGVQVGMAENNSADKTAASDLANSNITILGTANSSGDHATWGAKAIVGTYGLVPDAELFSVSTVANGMYAGIERVLAVEGIDVLNCSAGFKYLADYLNDSTLDFDEVENVIRWFDHIASQHNITVVVPAGNYANRGCMISSLAYNVITTGGYNTNNTIGYDDDEMLAYSFNTNTSYAAKPDFLAPGSYVFGAGGTCASAVITTGVISQMIEYDNNYGTGLLSSKPYLIKAILTASCSRKLSGESLGTLTQRQGAGIISARDAISIISGGTYATGNANSTSTTHNFIAASGAERLRVALAWEKYTMFISDHGNEAPSYLEYPITNLGLVVYGQQNPTTYFFFGQSNHSNSSLEVVNYTRPVANNNTYRSIISKPTSTEYSPRYAIAWY